MPGVSKLGVQHLLLELSSPHPLHVDTIEVHLLAIGAIVSPMEWPNVRMDNADHAVTTDPPLEKICSMYILPGSVSLETFGHHIISSALSPSAIVPPSKSRRRSEMKLL